MAEENLLPGDFVSGVVRYTDTFPDRPESRIIIPVLFGENNRTYAVVDTAATYCVLDPDEAEILDLNQFPRERDEEGMSIRGFILKGWRCRIPVTLVAARGESITIEATVFVPELDPSQVWNLPNFLGLTGFLERIRFAVDPGLNRFYFGPLGSQAG